jgi:hypothetical protein
VLQRKQQLGINLNHTTNSVLSTDSDLNLDCKETVGNINVSDNRVINVQDPVNNQDAVTKIYLDSKLDFLSSGTISDIESVLNRLTPDTPPTIDTVSISLSSTQSLRITDFPQTDNTTSGLTYSAGTILSNVIRSNDYNLSLITQIGPGDSDTLSVIRNNVTTSTITFDEADNSGTYTNVDSIIISNNVDYGTITGDSTGFYQCFDSQVLGINTVSEGWNNVKLVHGNNETNIVDWYSEQSNPGSPVATNIIVQPSTTQTGIEYSSSIPHYNYNQVFDISFDVSNLSGDFYPVSDVFFNASPTSTSALQPLNDLTYQDVGISIPLPRNYLSNSSHTVNTYTQVQTGTGIGEANVGPSATVDNSYSITSMSFLPGYKVLYMDSDTAYALAIHESKLYIDNVGIGAGNPKRLETTDGDNPIETNFVVFDGEVSTLNDWDATVVGGILTHDVTNYSLGYYPPGPNLNTIERATTQYIQFGFNRSIVSKFGISWSGKVSGCSVKLPGSNIDNTSDINGWLDTTLSYEGSGIPGSNTANGGNGSNGCALGGTLPTGIQVTNKVTNITFGTESSSNANDYLIVIRFKLEPGDNIGFLQIINSTQ